MTQPNPYVANHGRRSYWKSLLIALDQLANALLWGYVDETLSSRAYRSAHKRRWKIVERLINGLFFWDKQHIGGRIVRHCELAYLAEWHGEHLPGRLRQGQGKASL